MSHYKTNLTVIDLKQKLVYSPDTGIFTKNGKIVGSKRPTGYVSIWVNGSQYYAHRLAVLYMTGQWPIDVVDHIDQNKLNNTWKNLRCIDNALNVRLQKKRVTNLSGHRGVCWHKQHEKWLVRINVNTKQIFGGIFKDFEEACKKAKELHEKYASRN